MNPSDTPTPEKRQGRFFYGWIVVAVASVQGMFGNGTISSGFPIFFLPIQRDLNISYTSMSLVFSLGRAEGGLGGPIVGYLVDRFGARPMILIGGLLASTGIMLVSRAENYWQFILLFVGVVSVGKTAGLGQTLMAVVNQWFVRRKSLALSTLMTSFAGGGAIVVPVLGWGIANHGWRPTLFFMGAFMIVITLFVSATLRSRPEDMGLNPDGDPAPAPTTDDAESKGKQQPLTDKDFTVREAIRTSAFWFMLLGLTVRVSATNAIIIHLFPILQDAGLTEQRAAVFVSVMFFVAIPLRFGLGVAGDYVSPRYILFFGMLAPAIGLFGLLLVDGIVGIMAFMVGLAIVEGITSANWIMVGNYFGRARFASLMGFMSIFHNIGMVVSPIFSGKIRDITGEYDLVLMTFAPLFVIGSVAFLFARRPKLNRASTIESKTVPSDDD